MKKFAGILFIALSCAGCHYPELSEDEFQELTGVDPTETPNGGGTNLVLNKTDIAATAAAATYTITVKSTGIWAATVATGDTWCSLGNELGMGNGTITVNVQANTTTSSRSASITVTAEAVTKTVTVTQAVPAAPVNNFTETGGGLNFDMIGVAGGIFTMGATAEQGSNYPKLSI